MAARGNKQREYFRKKRLQTRYVLYYLALLVGSSAVLGYLIYQRVGAALRAEMYLTHSATTHTWQIIGKEILSASVVVTLLVAAGALLITLGITWAVHRASTAVRHDLRFSAERGPDDWKPVRHPREFGHLQGLLADALRSHRERLSRLDESSAGLQDEVRGVRGEWAGSGHETKHARLRKVHVRFERLRADFRAFRMR